MHTTTRDEFRALAAEHRVVPVTRKVLADSETPLSAYRKLPGLYNMTVLAASVNQPTQGVLGRLDVQGIAFDNGMKLARHYLQAFRWEAAP